MSKSPEPIRADETDIGVHAHISGSALNLMVAFASMIALMLLLTFVGLYALDQNQKRLETVVYDHMQKYHLGVEMLRNARSRTVSLQKMTRLQDDFDLDEEIMRFHGYGSEFARARIALLELNLTPEEHALLDSQAERSRHTLSVQRQALELIQVGKVDEAQRVLIEEGIPTQDAALQVVEKLHKLQTAKVDAAGAEARASYRKAWRVIVTTAMATALIALMIAWYVTVRIKRSATERDLYVREIRSMNDELTRNADALIESRDRAEQANHAKSRFLATMSHELRTPLNAIIGYSEMLEEDVRDGAGGDPEQMAADLRRIQTAGRNLLALINDVLDLSKIEAGKMEPYAETFDLDALLKEVAETALPLAGKLGNTLRVTAHPDPLGEVHTDVVKLRQILLNMLSNAAKFTENGIIALEARRDMINGQDRLAFTVSDTGIGMSDEQMERIFKPFCQADGSTTRRYGGTGLGLTLTRRFCELLGGEVAVDSELGLGTSFVVQIPAQAPASEDDRAAERDTDAPLAPGPRLAANG